MITFRNLGFMALLFASTMITSQVHAQASGVNFSTGTIGSTATTATNTGILGTATTINGGTGISPANTTIGLPAGYSQNASAGYWGSGQSGSGDCDPAVAQIQAQAKKDFIADTVALAAPGVGYSLLPDGGMILVSCVNSLLNSNINIFGVTSLGDIVQALEQAACNDLHIVANMGADYLFSPINQALNGSLPIGQLIPGVDLGSMSGGMLLKPNIGGAAPGTAGTIVPSIGGTAMGVPVNINTQYSSPANFNNMSNFGTIWTSPSRQ